MEKNREYEFSFAVYLAKSATKWLYLNKNSINLSYTLKESEEAYSYGLTMDCPWWALPRHSSVLSSFHRNNDLGVSMGGQGALI